MLPQVAPQRDAFHRTVTAQARTCLEKISDSAKTAMARAIPIPFADYCAADLVGRLDRSPSVIPSDHLIASRNIC